MSILVDAGLCRARGLPEADYFLWNDDFEFTARLLRGQAGLLCPASVVVHKTAAFGSTDADPGQRFFYEVRNKVWTLRAGSSLAPAERVLYGGATLRRWARTFAKSSDRGTLRSCLLAGLAAGFGPARGPPGRCWRRRAWPCPEAGPGPRIRPEPPARLRLRLGQASRRAGAASRHWLASRLLARPSGAAGLPALAGTVVSADSPTGAAAGDGSAPPRRRASSAERPRIPAGGRVTTAGSW